MFDSLYKLLGQILSFFYDLVPNYGVAIVLLTIFVRVVLLPLTIKQTKSMQAMQKIQPQMKELQAKHKGDKQRLNEEMMKLYKSNQVNPLGGCLPLVLQFPVFIALFRVLNTCGAKVAKGQHCPRAAIGTKYLPAGSGILTAIQTGNTGFLGMKMGTSPAEVVSQSGPLAAIPYFLLLALMGLTTWYQTKQAAGAQPPGANNQMAVIGKVMPVMLMLFSYRFPAGVSIYWVVSNLWTIGQQRVLLGSVRTQPGAATPPKGGGAAGGASRGSGGGPKAPKGAGGTGGTGGGARADTGSRGDGVKTNKGKGAAAAPEARGPRGGASQKPGVPDGSSAKSGSPRAQGGQKPASGTRGGGGGGNGRNAAAKGDGAPAPKSGNARRPSGGGQARKRRGRR